MNKKLATVGIVATLFGGAALYLIQGCGLATAPVSVPEAIAQNTNFSFKGGVFTQDGEPLDGVLMAKRWSHHFWTPVNGGTDTSENELQRVDKVYSVNERGTELHLTFSHDGYADATYHFSASDPDYVTTPSGDWKIAKDFPVILYANGKPDESLHTWDRDIDYSNYPTTRVIDLQFSQLPQDLDVTNAVKSTPGHLYLSLVKEAPPAINSKGDVDPSEVNLPGRITLHITGPEGGFIRMAPRLGYHPLKSSDIAPTTGYNPEFTIDRARLLEMRRSPKTRIIEAHEYFFFKSENHYGKGMIEWTESVPKEDKTVHPISFHIYLWMQPHENDPTLTTRNEIK